MPWYLFLMFVRTSDCPKAEVRQCREWNGAAQLKSAEEHPNRADMNEERQRGEETNEGNQISVNNKIYGHGRAERKSCKRALCGAESEL